LPHWLDAELAEPPVPHSEQATPWQGKQTLQEARQQTEKRLTS
jgi:hypothetical protein|tara:strand:+ start:179 stop:307 length:129 start_codon:yes stop_codon:yes gene_type:complete